MSELVVGSLKGLAANGFVIDVASGSKLVQPGAVLQVVSTTKTDAFTSASATFTAVTGLSATITPSSSTSKILVIASLTGAGTSGVTEAYARLMRGATAIAVGDAAGSSVRGLGGLTITASLEQGLSVSHLDSPATTSATTYSFEARTQSGSGLVYVNRSANDSVRGASSITLMEIAG
jgi:hypothetical protein